MGIFNSFFMGGFESACHRRHDRQQIDVQAAIGHDIHCAQDYAMLQSAGIQVARDALRWHLIETAPGRYDWSSFLPLLRAARDTNMQVIWDLCHWGLPHDLDIFSAEFVGRFADFAAAAAAVVRSETKEIPFYCVINEISFWAWIGGDCETFYPYATGRGGELKRQLVRATIAAIDAVRKVEPRARFVQGEPIIYIAKNRLFPEDDEAVVSYVQAQYEAWDMLSGRLNPELGGGPGYLDILGANYYWNNQWEHLEEPLALGNALHRPLAGMLTETYARYNRPFLITETGAEGHGANSWLRYVAGEVRAAISAGTPIEGVCLYPISDYPGWDDNRHCQCGLISIDEDWRKRSVRADVAATLVTAAEHLK